MTQTSLNNVSIRLLSGGHSFSSADIDAVRNASQPVEVTVISAKSTLVPAEVFDKEHAEDFLHEVGIYPTHSECVVYSDADDGAVAVMAMNAECYAQLMEAATHGITFSSPLIDEKPMKRGCVLHLEGGVLYVLVYNGGLRLAEAVECTSDADVLYYLSTIGEVYDIYNMYARVCGDTKRLMPHVKRLFKEYICEL